MVAIKNPFRKQDENVRPTPSPLQLDKPVSAGSNQHFDLDAKQPVEYKLSEINDSGMFMPPSPTEKKTFWGTTSSRSTTSSSLHRCAFNENDQFNISRESFDSYRRSFDISARSPVLPPESRPRASLDSRTFLPPPRMSNSFQRPVQVPQTQEEDKFEDVSIDDPKPPLVQKKRGIFARMVDGVPGVGDASNRPTTSSESRGGAWHNLTSRRRGQSGQGAELGSMPKREELTKQPPTPMTQSTPMSTPMQHCESPKVENTQAPEIQVDS